MSMRCSLLAIVAMTGLAAHPAGATSLREALVQAYRGNPTLTGQRASQRATDEGVPLARAAGLPNVASTGQYSEFLLRQRGSSIKRLATADVTLNVPIYSGGAVKNGIRAADARVEQGQATLRSTEANIFTQVVGAYLDVIRDTAIVELNRGNVRVLETNLQASNDRFQVGDLTRTDVAQSDARLAIARSQLQSALAQLDSSRENYLRLVGSSPDALEPPPPLPQFPATPDDAVDVALESNPDLIAAKRASRAADYDIRVAQAERLPTLSAFGTADYTNFLGSLSGGIAIDPGTGLPIPAAASQTQKTATVGVRATLPLFQGGRPGALVRQAQARKSQTLEQITATERSVIADACATYSLYVAAQEVIRSSQQAVSANELALEGTRAENSVGTRNVLDVLNAEQELLNSRVQLVTARRDAYVAGFALLAAIGRAEARDLGLDGGILYDPQVNYRRVRGSINDWAQDPKPQPVAPSTAGIPLPSQTLIQGPPAPAAQPLTTQSTTPSN